MNTTKQAAWLFIALLSMAFSTWYFASSNPKVAKLDTNSLSTTSDAVVHQLSLVQYGENGQLSHSLKTPLLRHIPLNNTHWLKTPHIIVVQDNQAAWDIHAAEATALYGGQQITFKKNVIIHQDKTAHSQESTLKTEEITYFPKEKKATTLANVTFEQPGSRVQSTGMTAYLAEKRVRLLSQARGTYAPGPG